MLLFGGEDSVSDDAGFMAVEEGRLADGLLDGLRADGRDVRDALVVVLLAAGLAEDDLLAVPLVLDDPLVLRERDDAVVDRDREVEVLGRDVPLERVERVAVAATGLADDMDFAAALSAFAAVVIDFVAVFIARMALDIVFADALALVAAAVILVAADVTLVAAEDTPLAAVAAVVALLAEVRPDRAAVDRDVVERDAVDRDAMDRELDLDADGRDEVLRDERDAVLRPAIDRLRDGVAVRDAVVDLDLDMAAGRLAVPPDALRLPDLLRAVLVVLRRAAARFVV